jgi:MoxR-like ATPase
MQERQVTVDLETIDLPRPFLMLATQNPIEMEGTFPLPEAQLDRFFLRIKLGYPTAEEEGAILFRFQDENKLLGLKDVMKAAELLDLQKIIRHILVADPIRNYIVAIIRATREHPDIRLGASPRASLGLQAASQALAAIRGRNYVIPDDVKHLAVPALAHRIIAKSEIRLRGKSAEDIIGDIIAAVPVPVE